MAQCPHPFPPLKLPLFQGLVDRILLEMHVTSYSNLGSKNANNQSAKTG